MTIDEAVLKEIFVLSEKVGSVPFPMIVKASSGFDVIPINLEDPKDKELLKTLNRILNSYLSTLKKTHGRLEGDRPNEVGSRIEAGLVHEMKSSPLKVRQLIKKGYPDIEISEENGRLTYMEVKTSSSVEPSDLRYFYYSSGEKIKGNARHLLLNIAISKVPNSGNIWKVEKCSISDLSKLSVKLKAEFNATQRDLADKSMEIFSCEIK